MTVAAAVALVLLLGGCMTPPHHQDFAASWPEELPRDAPSNGAIFQAGYDVPLFQNAVAHRVGDTVTIVLA
jgi:flagellar L-ring protein precursor FlgH